MFKDSYDEFPLSKESDTDGSPIDVGNLNEGDTDDQPIDVGTLNKGRTMRKASAKQYSPLECDSKDILHYGEFAVIETPNYADYERYPNDFDCKWDIEIPANSELLFWCEYFDVRRRDYLYIMDQAYYGYAPEGFKLPPSTSPDETATLSLRFKSNRGGTGYGFR